MSLYSNMKIGSHYNHIQAMPRAVSGGWVGSSAVNETGQRWMSAARTTLRLPAAGWMSEMVGISKELVVNITSSDHNFNTNVLHQWMLNAAGGSWPTNVQWKIVVHGGVQLVSFDTNNAVMWFGGAIKGKVIVENHGWIFGRGGTGGNAGDGWANNGANGGHAIVREGHITLEIINHGIIAGGGGGGGGATSRAPQGGYRWAGGGGGAPFGGGQGGGGNASITGGGAGASTFETYGGGGGNLGNNGAGGRGNSPTAPVGHGGSTGYSIAGGGPLALTVQGDLRGPVAW